MYIVTGKQPVSDRPTQKVKCQMSVSHSCLPPPPQLATAFVCEALYAIHTYVGVCVSVYAYASTHMYVLFTRMK